MAVWLCRKILWIELSKTITKRRSPLSHFWGKGKAIDWILSKMGQPRLLFCLFPFISNIFTDRKQLDLNSDCQTRRQTCWPLDHRYGHRYGFESYMHYVLWKKTKFGDPKSVTQNELRSRLMCRYITPHEGSLTASRCGLVIMVHNKFIATIFYGPFSLSLVLSLSLTSSLIKASLSLHFLQLLFNETNSSLSLSVMCCWIRLQRHQKRRRCFRVNDTTTTATLLIWVNYGLFSLSFILIILVIRWQLVPSIWAFAQLPEQMLETPDVCDSNPIIGKMYLLDNCWKD